MGKLAKPQRSKKQKKLKAIDPFYVGSRKDVRQKNWNQKPRNCEQEVPKKLKQLGFSVDGVKSGHVGKKSKNKFLHKPDAPLKYEKQFLNFLGVKPGSGKGKQEKPSADSGSDEQKQSRKLKKDAKAKISEADVSEFIDNLRPPRAFTEPFTFKQMRHESGPDFMRRIHQETQKVLAKTKIEEQYEVSDTKKLLSRLKAKKGMSDRKKERLKEKKKSKLLAQREKKEEKLKDFTAMQDKVEFGEVVHAPPVISVRPKRAELEGADRPGQRMPELKSAIEENMKEAEKTKSSEGSKKMERSLGRTLKRKALSSVQQQMADSQRDRFIEAYRQLKQSKHSVS